MRGRQSFWLLLAVLFLATCMRTPLMVGPRATAVPTIIPITPTPPPLLTPSPPPPTQTPLPTGTAVAVPTPHFTNPQNREMSQTAQDLGAEFVWLNEENTGIWQYAPGTFLHPIALQLHGNTAYLLDGGRILALNLAEPLPPQLLLSPGDRVAGVSVIEPLDLALTADGLLVLDRAGDVYLYDPLRNEWSVERYDRPIGETSSHYYVALANRVLLEPSYNFALEFGPQRADRFWLLPEQTRPVDVGTDGERMYALVQETVGLTTTVHLYEDATLVDSFQPTVTITQPRQLVATDTAVTVLDEAGQRLVALDPQSGAVQRIIQPPPISTFWTDGRRLILAGKERLYFVNEPEQWQQIAGGPLFVGVPLYDTAVWSAIDPFIVPVQGTHAGARELQMPGAPRHYRLGVHEGTDFYWGVGTPVRAVADGVVIKATHDYELPDADDFGRRYDEIQARGYSSAADREFYRGMQVWIQHPDGMVARYAHLSGIEEEVVVGTAVTAGQIIGKIGNSGSPASVNSATEDAHLHFELWIDGHYLGQYLRPVEVRELVNALFP